jgi:hypothetical protein
METNPKKESVNEKDRPEELKHVAAGTPAPSGPENDKKHVDDSAKPAAQLDEEATEEFEGHNMNHHSGYNEIDRNVPIENKNIAADEQEAKK